MIKYDYIRMHLQVECCAKDLHSGVFGGTVHEGMADLVYLLNTLLDNKGNILIPGKTENKCIHNSHKYPHTQTCINTDKDMS